MDIISREKFIELFDTEFKKLHSPIKDREHPIWIPETANEIKFESAWFICIKPIEVDGNFTTNVGFWTNYWQWSRENLTGQHACYSSSFDTGEEWWGFEHKEDILIWVLRWAK